jgi:signal transduction histidine kinase
MADANSLMTGLASPLAPGVDLPLIFDHLGTGVVACDRDRTITAINRAAHRLLLPQPWDAALPTATTLATTVKLYYPGNRQPIPPQDFPLWRVLRGEILQDMELAVVHPQGNRAMVLVGGQPLRAAQGQIVGAVISLYDITQRYHSETVLRFSNNGLKTKARQRLEDLQATNRQLQQEISQRQQVEHTLQDHAQRLQGLRRMDHAILSNFQPQDIARSALALLCQLLGCQQGLVALFDPDQHRGDIIAANPQDTLFSTGTPLPLTDFVFAQGHRRCRIRRVNVLHRHQLPPLIFQCFLATQLQSAMAVPLVVNGEVIGEVILADHRPSYFSADHEEVVQEVTDHLAIALQNARLFEQVTGDRQRLKDLSSQLLEAQETERRWLAHELHDEVGQALTAVKLNLHRLERLVDQQAKSVLDDCLHIADGALQQVRNLSLDLRPSMLDDLGLWPALRWYVSRHAERTGLREVLLGDPTLPTLPPQVETACFRIVQEALTNIVRHAQATTVTITLTIDQQQLHLAIQDDGIGFDVDAIRHAKRHGTSLGLIGMEERGLLIGGQLTLVSSPHQGTCVDLRVPLP